MTLWPARLEHLTFLPGVTFNLPLAELPASLKTLKLLNGFNQPLLSFPSNLAVLFFGPKFNQQTDYLPVSLTDLNFGNAFNQSVDNLPPFLLRLSLGRDFNQPLANLPVTLKFLDLSRCDHFSFPLNYLPPTLHKLHLSRHYQLKLSSLHNWLKVASLSVTLATDIPHSVSELRCSFNTQLSFSSFSLPRNLESLTLDPPGFVISIWFKKKTLTIFNIHPLTTFVLISMTISLLLYYRFKLQFVSGYRFRRKFQICYIPYCWEEKEIGREWGKIEKKGGNVK